MACGNKEKIHLHHGQWGRQFREDGAGRRREQFHSVRPMRSEIHDSGMKRFPMIMQPFLPLTFNVVIAVPFLFLTPVINNGLPLQKRKKKRQ